MTKPAILFLCVHNAGRSQMAAAFARTFGGDAVSIYSAGTDPSDVLEPTVIDAMAEAGIDIRLQSPKGLTDEVVSVVDVVVTMGCGDQCSLYLGTYYEDWELPDPAGQTIDVVRTIRDEIARRVRALLYQLTT